MVGVVGKMIGRRAVVEVGVGDEPGLRAHEVPRLGPEVEPELEFGHPPVRLNGRPGRAGSAALSARPRRPLNTCDAFAATEAWAPPWSIHGCASGGW